MLRDRLDVSERWACRVVGQHRSVQRYEPTVADDDQALRAELRAFAVKRPRWGYRRAHHHLRQQGWQVNRKRTQRLWREEGLRVPVRRQRKRPAGERPDGREINATAPDEVWALDFQADQTACGRPLRLVNVVDEHTREALVMHVGRSMNADETVAQLEALIAARGRAPKFLRMDNGPELTSHALRDCAGAPAPRRCSSSPARRGRTRLSSPSTPESATSCSTSSNSPAWPRPAWSSPTGARTTTPAARTRRSGCSPRPRSPPHAPRREPPDGQEHARTDRGRSA
jgi:transposase InsO family protein